MRSSQSRQQLPFRSPWNADYLHIQTLLRDIAAHSPYVQGRTLDVGCGNKPYQTLFHEVEHYVGIDIDTNSSKADLSGLAYALPFANESFDTIFSTQTLEHLEFPQLAIMEMARVLRSGGYFLLTAPQTWRIHEEPYDFYRFTRFGLQHLLEQSGLHVLKIIPQGGVWTTVCQIINNALHKRFQPYLPRYFLYIPYFFNNLLSAFLDYVWFDSGDTVNYFVLAQKKPIE